MMTTNRLPEPPDASEIQEALETIDRTLGLYELDIDGYHVVAMAAEYGGGFNIEVVWQQEPVLRNGTLAQVAAYLARHTEHQEES